MSMCLNLAGSSVSPMTKLFGRSATGLNATGRRASATTTTTWTARGIKLRPVLGGCCPLWPCPHGA